MATSADDFDDHGVLGDASSVEVELACERQNSTESIVELASLRQLFFPILWPWAWMMMVRCLVITVLPMHILNLGLSYQDIGLLTAVNGLGTVFGNLPAGTINAKFGPRCANIVEGLVYCASSCLLSLPLERDAWLVMAAIAALLAGFAETLGILSRHTMLGAAVPAEFRGRAGSVMGGMWRAGCMLGPLIGGNVARVAGTHAVFVLQGCLALVHVAWAIAFIPYISASQDINGSGVRPRKGEQVPEESARSVASRHWKPLLRYSVFSCLIMSFRKSRELLFAMEGHRRHMSQAEVGSVAALSFLVDAMGFPMAGLLMDGAGRVVAATLSLAFGAAAMLILECNSLHLAVFAIIVGFANAMSAGLTLTIGADIAPSDCRAKFLALYRTVGKSSDLFAPVTLGVLAHNISMQAANLSVAGLCILGVLWGQCCVEETLRKDPDSEPAERRRVGSRDGMELMEPRLWSSEHLRDGGGRYGLLEEGKQELLPLKHPQNGPQGS